MQMRSRHTIGICLATTVFASALAAIAHAEEPGPEELVDALNGVFGNHKMRASHAKGQCVTGSFTPSEEGPTLSEAALFTAPSSVLGRFSAGGGNPKAADNTRGARGLALRLTQSDGDSAEFVLLSVPLFFARTPAQVLGFLQARVPGPDGKPDPEKIKAFAEANPETTRQGAWIAERPIPAGYTDTSYWGIHAFTLTNAEETVTTVKFKLVPTDGEVTLTDDEAKEKSADFYIGALEDRLAKGPASFDFTAIIGEDGDPTDDPTLLWPETERKSVTLGTLEIAALEDQATCDETIFAPSNLPKGIAGPENDQIFPLRTPAYAVSFSRRTE